MSREETTWSRRGHIRKPNTIVRGIYWIADWLGDFKQLAFFTKRGVGHVSVFAGYSLLLLMTLAINLFIVITSAVHSLKLLHWIGFSGWTAYPILFVVEAIFITGSIQMDLAFKHGKYFPIPPILGFTIGLFFVLASNVMGLANNIGGLFFGTATPFLLIISKAMLAWQYTFKSKIAKQSREKNPVSETREIMNLEDENNAESTVENITESIEKKPPENPINNRIKTIENPEEISRDKPRRTKDLSPTKKRKKSSKKKPVDEDAIFELAMQLKTEGKLTQSSLEKEAGCTTHYAKKSIARLKQLDTENQLDIQTENPERKLSLVK